MTWRSRPPGTRRRSALPLAVVALVIGVLAAASPLLPPPASAAANATPVMAPNHVGAADLAGWFRSTGKTAHSTASIDSMATYFISEGADEGVSGDVAFAQSIVETGYFTFSTRVPASSNNFSGLGAVDGGQGAAKFSTARTGVRAQIQHLRAYGDPTVTTAKLHHTLVDPRFDLVSPKGKAPTWDTFGNGVWATDPDYAGKVLAIYGKIRDWAAAHHAWTPFATSTQLVQQGYRDVLFREGTASPVASWARQLQDGSTTPAGFLASLVAREGVDHAQPVSRLYLAALDRLPDRSGLSYWTRRHAAGVQLIELARQFVGSAEFTRRFGHPDDADFVDLLYRNVLGRAPDPSGADYWTRRLEAGKITRPGLVVQFSESSEYVKRTAPTAEASEIYLGMLLRAPTPEEVFLWTDRRSKGAPLAELTGQVFSSAAYAARFS